MVHESIRHLIELVVGERIASEHVLAMARNLHVNDGEGEDAWCLQV